EEKKFVEQMQSDQELQQRVEDYQVLFSGFRALRQEQFQQQLQSWNEEHPLEEAVFETTQDEVKKSNNKTAFAIRTFLVAASVVGLLGLGYWWWMQGSISVLEAFLETEAAYISMDLDLEKSTASATSTTAMLLQEAQIDYAHGAYEKSKDRVRSIAPDSPDYLPAQYLIAHAEFKQGNYGKATEDFEKVLQLAEKQNFIPKEKATWVYLLALSHQMPTLSEEELVQLATTLQTFIDQANPNNIYLRKAKRLQELLNSQ
ncbi:MAG: hypothetical protein AAGD05_16745, partial [Bacteroidota bacterium]